MLVVRALTGPEARFYIDDLARLRMDVFRQWPYLYDGDMDYERSYLSAYFQSESAFIVGVLDDDRLVGASTAVAMAQADRAFSQPLDEAGIDCRNILYFGESVLKAQFRGRGFGKEFFSLREAEAIRQGLGNCVFCSVERQPDHPMFDIEYRSLEGFWKRLGYEPLRDINTAFKWKDIGDDEETLKPMRYWIKSL